MFWHEYTETFYIFIRILSLKSRQNLAKTSQNLAKISPKKVAGGEPQKEKSKKNSIQTYHFYWKIFCRTFINNGPPGGRSPAPPGRDVQTPPKPHKQNIVYDMYTEGAVGKTEGAVGKTEGAVGKTEGAVGKTEGAVGKSPGSNPPQ
jgi:hypothetical protein